MKEGGAMSGRITGMLDCGGQATDSSLDEFTHTSHTPFWIRTPPLFLDQLPP